MIHPIRAEETQLVVHPDPYYPELHETQYDAFTSDLNTVWDAGDAQNKPIRGGNRIVFSRISITANNLSHVGREIIPCCSEMTMTRFGSRDRESCK